MNTGKKISRNFILGIASELLTILLGIMVPRLLLTNYGSEVNGLLSSVTQIYSYIALLEAGIGTATVQALYKTIGKKDRDGTNAVLAATNKYYKKTSVLYFGAIVIFSIVYPIVISTDIPVTTVVLVIFFNGLGSVINFLVQGKYFLLLQAEGKNYIKTGLTMATNVLKNVLKIILLFFGVDVVFVQAIAMAVSLIQMAFVVFYIKKYYPWIDLKAKPDFEAISQSKNVLVHQVSGLIYNNTDSITLSVFCGLQVVSVYSMYIMLYSMISTALNTVSSSIVFSLGQMFHIDRKEFMRMYDAYELYYMTLVFSLYSVANYFILPFLKLYTAGVNDIQYVDPVLPILFVSVFLLSCGRSAPSQVINYAGHFKKTQNRAILEAAINIVASVIAVQFLGIYGVLIGTIIALLYRSNDIIIYACRHILHIKVFRTYKRWFILLTVFTAASFAGKLLPFEFASYTELIIVAVPYLIVTLILFFSISSLFYRETAAYAFSHLKKLLRKKKRAE